MSLVDEFQNETEAPSSSVLDRVADWGPLQRAAAAVGFVTVAALSTAIPEAYNHITGANTPVSQPTVAYVYVP